MKNGVSLCDFVWDDGKHLFVLKAVVCGFFVECCCVFADDNWKRGSVILVWV